MKTAPAIIIALLIVAGCRMETETTATARYDTVYAGSRDEYLTWLRAAPACSAAYADSVNGIAPKDTAAKVAAVMEANGITLPQVAAYLDAYGFDVVGRAATLRPHWSPAPPGRDAQGNTVPVAYYIANIRIAVGDTTLAIYAPQAVGPVWMRVKAYDGRGMSSTWSATEVSGPGALLPGVAE